MRCLVLACLPLAACATKQLYEGPARDSREVARITSHTASAYRVYVREFDGREMNHRWKQSRTLELLPGNHTLVLQVYYRTGIFGGGQLFDIAGRAAESLAMPEGGIVFDFPTTAGGRYVFETRIRNGQVRVELEDEETGELTAGERLEGIWAAPWP